MTIFRIAKKKKSFTVLDNTAIDDSRLSTKALGVYVRLISKSEGWEISATGMEKLYPTEGKEFYRNALKQLCKFGYLVKIPQPRDAGKFSKDVMELHETPQIEEPLTDDQVDYLFSKIEHDPREIQKIYPKRVFRHGSTDTVKNLNKSTDDKHTEKQKNPKKASQPSCSVSEHAFRLVDLLYENILEIDPQAKPPNREKWAKDLDRMHRIDGRSWGEIEALIQYVASDPFWRTVVLSASKMRSKATQLIAKRKTEATQTQPTTNKDKALRIAENFHMGDRCKLEALNNHCEIGCAGYQPICISYDDQNFEYRVEQALKHYKLLKKKFKDILMS